MWTCSGMHGHATPVERKIRLWILLREHSRRHERRPDAGEPRTGSQAAPASVAGHGVVGYR